MNQSRRLAVPPLTMSDPSSDLRRAGNADPALDPASREYERALDAEIAIEEAVGRVLGVLGSLRHDQRESALVRALARTRIARSSVSPATLALAPPPAPPPVAPAPQRIVPPSAQPRTSVSERIVAFLRTNGPQPVQEIAGAVYGNAAADGRHRARGMLANLRSKALVEPTEDGRWRLRAALPRSTP